MRLNPAPGGSRRRGGRAAPRRSSGTLRAATARPRAGSVGANAQPAGSSRSGGTRPGISRSRPRVRRAGAGSRRAGRSCTGAAGAANSSCTGASSALRPAYRTSTRSAMSATTPRSCVIRTIAVPSRSRISRIRSRMPGLGRDVERGRRLVGDQDLRVAGERHRDHHALPHPARELVRVLVDAPLRRGDVHEPSSSIVRVARVAAREAEVLAQDLADLPADREHRVERGRRLLEDERDLAAADAPQLRRRRREQVDAVEERRAR